MSSAAILSWNKTSHAQKEQFDWSMKLNVATQVAGKVLHCAMLFAMIAGTKKLQQMSVAGYVTLGNISCNLCRNKIARQVAREIALCNSAFSTH